MINPKLLVKIGKDITLYPSTEGSIVTMSAVDGTQYEAHVLKAEANLAHHLRQLFDKYKMTKHGDFDDLIELIDEFGSAKYREGSDDGRLENEDW